MSEALKRDRELREDLAWTAWPGEHEQGLKALLLSNPPPPLDQFPFVWADEWLVVPGRDDCGKGDLIFTDGQGRFAVVELKWFDHRDTGRTRRARRNHKRNKVREQASRYAETFWHLEPAALDVRAFTFGNLYDGPPTLVEIVD